MKKTLSTILGLVIFCLSLYGCGFKPKETQLTVDNIEEYLMFDIMGTEQSKMFITYGKFYKTIDLAINTYPKQNGSFYNAEVTLEIYNSKPFTHDDDENTTIKTITIQIPVDGKLSRTDIAKGYYDGSDGSGVNDGIQQYVITSVSGTFVEE